MTDLTVIFLTANNHPKHWTEYHKNILLKAIGKHDLITVSRKPLDFGHNIIDRGPKSHINMYYQLMEAAKIAKTPFVAVAEDDVLYHENHFNFFRPPLDTFAYNMNRWSLYSWVPDLYSMKQRKSNCTLIAPRELLIEAWTERFAKHPIENYPIRLVSEVGRANMDGWLGVTVRKSVEVYDSVGVIHINHPNGTDSTGMKKRLGEVRAYDIPYWGKACELIKEYR